MSATFASLVADNPALAPLAGKPLVAEWIAYQDDDTSLLSPEAAIVVKLSRLGFQVRSMERRLEEAGIVHACSPEAFAACNPHADEAARETHTNLYATQHAYAEVLALADLTDGASRIRRASVDCEVILATNAARDAR